MKSTKICTRDLKIFYLVLLFVIFIANQEVVLCQEDSVYVEETGAIHFHHRPTISLAYGFTTNRLKYMVSSFSNPRFLELELGKSSEFISSERARILRYEHQYISLTNISNNLGNKSTSGKINTDLWRIGFGWEKGYGYMFDEAALITYTSIGIHWSRLRLLDQTLSAVDSSLLLPFNRTFRFGTFVEGGVMFQVTPLLSIDASYERALVFPAHLFWKWLGSVAIEAVGQELLNEFIHQIMKTSPSAVPIVSVLLKGGFSYAIYELRREKMNYPFVSSPPLLNDSFKIGLTTIF